MVAATGKIDSPMYVRDELSGRRFLIDTGAQVSVLPTNKANSRASNLGPVLTAANGSTIRTFGTRTMQLLIGSHHYDCAFILADVSQPILGADFLRNNSLLVDLKGQRLIDAETFVSVPISASRVSALHLNAIGKIENEFHHLLSAYPEITTPTFSEAIPKHGVEHHITTTGPPVHAHARRLPPDKLLAAKAEFAAMESMGIIRRSNSPWSSPLHVVTKKDGSSRPCGDYRRLNDATVPDRYPIAHLHDFSSNLAGTSVFSKIDLIRGYHQIPVNQADVAKTAVITPFGLFEFLRMPFGLKNAAQAFQRLMDKVCQGLDRVYVYLDDILIASVNQSQHLADLTALFERLKQFGLVVNPTKCVFAVSEINFLGHQITQHGAIPLPEKVAAIRSFPQPSTIIELQQFVGMVNFYHRFIPSAARHMQPLFAAMTGKSKRAHIFWTDDMTRAFIDIKQALADATMLTHPHPDAVIALVVDASDTAVGGVLEQSVSGSWRPLAFFSRQLRPPETKYSAFDRELLAVHLAVRHFRSFLEGRNFTIFTDHKPLTFAMKKVTEPWSARQQRHLAAISEFTTDIQHVAGKENLVADALSRIKINVVSIISEIDYEAMARAQQLELTNLGATAPGLQIEQFPVGKDESFIICDVSLGSPRPVVPQDWRKRVFDSVHNLSHPGVRTTRKMVASKFVWTGMNKQVGEWARTCIACQQSKITRHVRAPVEHITVPNRRFDEINIDLVGPLPPSQGFTYLFTIVDRFTRWPEAIPLADISAASCARALVQHWISRFGLPLNISSDRGPQFTSQLWSALAELLGTKLHHTTAYHPQANGLVERFHRNLKDALKARLHDANWIDELPWVLLGIRTAPKEDLNASSAELVYGYPLTVPGDFICKPTSTISTSQHLQQLRNIVKAFAPTQTATHGTPSSTVTKNILNSKFAFLRRDGHRTPLQRPYEGPFEVIKADEKTFTLAIGDRHETVSIDRIKPAHFDVSQPVQVALPKPRGRPPIIRPLSAPSPTSLSKVTEFQTQSGRAIRKPMSRFPGHQS